MDHIGLGVLITVIGWIVLVAGIILGNARVVGIGAGTLFVAEMVP